MAVTAQQSGAGNPGLAGGAGIAASAAPRSAPLSSPRRGDRLAMWLILAAVLGIMLPPALIMLRRVEVTQPAEALAVAVSAETWKRQAEMIHARGFEGLLVPVYHGRARLDQPPGETWIHLLMLQTLDPATASHGQIVHRARLTSVLGGLLLAAGVFWAAYAIGGIATASFSALVIAANPVVTYYMRMGTADIPGVAFVVIAVASALWAMRPHRRAPSLSRQGLGFLIAGLSLGMATLTVGPAALPLVLLPLALTVLLCEQRVAHLVSLFAVLAIALLLTTPWVLYTHRHDPEMWIDWSRDTFTMPWTDPGAYLTLSGQRFVIGLLATLPWTIWLISALLQPFSTSSTGVRSRMFIGWTWFASSLLVVFLMPGDRELRDLLPVLAAAAVMVGQLFRQLADLSAEGRHARVWRVCRWPMIGTLILLSVAVPVFMTSQDLLIEQGWLDQRLTAPMHFTYDLMVGAVLLTMAILSTRFAVKHYPGKALTCWSLWTVLLTSALAMPVSMGPMMRTGPRPDAPTQQILPMVSKVNSLGVPASAGMSASNDDNPT